MSDSSLWFLDVVNFYITIPQIWQVLTYENHVTQKLPESEPGNIHDVHAHAFSVNVNTAILRIALITHQR
jgi:hypothetical protein